MTDFTESHGLQGGTPTSTVGRRPWKAPRLIDLDDLDVACLQRMVGDPKDSPMVPEGNTPAKCDFLGMGAVTVS